ILLAILIAPDLGRYWPSAWNWMAAIWIFAGFCMYWGYYAIFEALWNGQTPGKRKTGIRVIKDSGRPITAFEAIARNFMRAIDSMPGMYGVAVITIFVDKRSRRLGDMVAGTVVVHDKKDESAEPFLTTSAPSVTATPAASASIANKLTLQELEIIETFLNRRLDLPPNIREQSAKRIADAIATKLEVPAEERGQDESFLEAVAREFRNTARFRV
ncbi:MAG TPA: RDD family protein, partial [Terriglobales bacterium]|nr:RDD family protein [Terriglobales bacterium]